jgi:hypothetical protein
LRFPALTLLPLAFLTLFAPRPFIFIVGVCQASCRI